jgi:hypothetical protein
MPAPDRTGRPSGALLLPLLLLLAAADAPAQALRPTVSLGFGSAVLDGESAPAFLAGVTAAGARHVVGARWTGVTEISIGAPANMAWEVGLLAGRRSAHGSGHTTYSAGLALVGGLRRGERIPSASDSLPPPFGPIVALLETEFETERFRTVGVPVEVAFVWAPLRHAGVGVTGFGNLNRRRPYGGAVVTVHAGALRPAR